VAAAAAIARRYGVEHRAWRVPMLEAVTRTALVNRRFGLPSPDLDDARATRESAKAVWVPNRNGVFINLAAAEAEALCAGEIIVGFNREEAATFPDNTVAYMRAASAALRCSTANGVRVASPTARWDKRRIVREGRRAGAPLDLIWPCYEGGRAWCRRCESCRRSLRALGDA
jgi:7-cyano-7-deazaguanine synthase